MKSFIVKMKNEGRDNASDNFKTSLNSLHNFFKKENILFSEMTSKNISEWIYSLKNTARAKSLYPSCVRKVFYSAMKEYNDYDFGIIRIRTNPFPNVEIPAEEPPQKRSVDIPNIIKLFFSKNDFELIRNGISRTEISKDVAILIFCLAGLNAADLYDMDSSCLKSNWKLCYRRKKTRDNRKSDPYMEIMVPVIIRPLFEKYKGRNKLFLFCERYTDSDGFVGAIDKGLKKFCDLNNMIKLTTYSLRHTWATVAQNNCNASTSDIAFAFTHASEHKVTERYIKEDFSRVDRLNNEVINYSLIQSFLLYIPFYFLME